MTEVPPGAVKQVKGEDFQTAGKFVTAAPGLHLFAYRSTWQLAEQTPEKFASYLQKEDLRKAQEDHRRRMAFFDAPAAQKKGLKRPTQIREFFSRCAKSLVACDGKADGGKHDRVVGLPLEIVAQANPLTTAPDKPLSFRVLLHGKPHANARLAAYREKTPDVVIETRTDADGRAALLMGKPGMWVVRCIRIEHVGKPRVDWESLWATLTFERKAPLTQPAPK